MLISSSSSPPSPPGREFQLKSCCFHKIKPLFSPQKKCHEFRRSSSSSCASSAAVACSLSIHNNRKLNSAASSSWNYDLHSNRSSPFSSSFFFFDCQSFYFLFSGSWVSVYLVYLRVWFFQILLSILLFFLGVSFFFMHWVKGFLQLYEHVQIDYWITFSVMLIGQKSSCFLFC